MTKRKWKKKIYRGTFTGGANSKAYVDRPDDAKSVVPSPTATASDLLGIVKEIQEKKHPLDNQLRVAMRDLILELDRLFSSRRKQRELRTNPSPTP